jgi:hypothetical protein
MDNRLKVFPPPQIVRFLTGVYRFKNKSIICTFNSAFAVASRLQKILKGFAVDSEIVASLGRPCTKFTNDRKVYRNLLTFRFVLRMAPTYKATISTLQKKVICIKSNINLIFI